MGFEEWTTVATIVLSVVAIGIAIWSSRSTSRAANNQIDELKRLCASQTDTINRLKQLSELQIDTTINLLHVEIEKVIAEAKKSANDCRAMNEIYCSQLSYNRNYCDEMMRKHQANKPHEELQIYNDCLASLSKILKNVDELKQKLG